MFNCIIDFFFTTPCPLRTGANAFNDGFNALMATSKRTWSFLYQYNHVQYLLNLFSQQSLLIFLAINGLDKAETNGYAFSYIKFPLIA